jgi:hypothetical protein
MRFLALSVCALALISGSSNAQQVSGAAAKGPTFQSGTVGFKVSEAKVDASTKLTAAPIVRRHQGQDVALMAVGVGAMIAGALIENNTASTIIIIGGAAMALFGLYHYLE